MPTDLEREIGHGNTGLIPWSAFSDVVETVPELAWPNSIATYSKMRTDAQIASLLLAFTLPIRRYGWLIEPNGARDEVVEHVADDLNLPIGGQDPKPTTRRRDRFSHDRHLFHALLCLTYGFMTFEQVYRFDDTAKGFHLRKLAPRMPGTISEIQVARVGGLEYIRQHPSGNLTPGTRSGSALLEVLQSPQIPVNRLVAYVNDQEAGNWLGISYLRALFRHWVRKDRLLRIDAITGERNGSGTPLAYAPRVRARSRSASWLPWRAHTERASPPAVRCPTVQTYVSAASREHCPTSSRRSATTTSRWRRGSSPCSGCSERQRRDREHSARPSSTSSLWHRKQSRSSTPDVTNEHVIEDLIDVNYSIDESAPLLKFSTDTDRKLRSTRW